jgi:hypothetical protein
MSGKCNPSHSILQYLIDAKKLELERGQRRRQASNGFTPVGELYVRRDHNSCSNIAVTTQTWRGKTELDYLEEEDTDNEARTLVKSYGQKVEEFIPVEVPLSAATNKVKGSKKRKKQRKRAPKQRRRAI